MKAAVHAPHERAQLTFLKKNAVMVIALLAALITSLIVPVDRTYLDYFDWKTLTCLFCVLAVVCALRNINFFYLLARQVVQRFRTARMSVLALTYITFLGSMLIATGRVDENEVLVRGELCQHFFGISTKHVGMIHA